MPANYQSDEKNEVVKNVKVPGNHALMLIIVFKTVILFLTREYLTADSAARTNNK